MQQDGAAQAPAPTVRAFLAAAAVAMLRVEPVDATRRRVAPAGEAVMVPSPVGEAVMVPSPAGEAVMVRAPAVQVTREGTSRHYMATTRAAERVALRLAGLERAAPMAQVQAEQPAVAPEVESAPTG